MKQAKLIQVRLSRDIEDKLAHLREMLVLPDNSTTVRWAISILENLLEEQRHGAEIRVKEKNGKEFRIDFPRGGYPKRDL